MRISDWSSDVCSSDLLCTAQILNDPGHIRDLQSRIHRVPALGGERSCHHFRRAGASHTAGFQDFLAPALQDLVNLDESANARVERISGTPTDHGFLHDTSRPCSNNARIELTIAHRHPRSETPRPQTDNKA